MMLLEESIRSGSQMPSTFRYRRSISVFSVHIEGRLAGAPCMRTMLKSSASTQI